MRFFTELSTKNIWNSHFFNYSPETYQFSKRKTLQPYQRTTTFDNQSINKLFRITFKLLKTYRLFILLIRKTSLALPKLLL